MNLNKCALLMEDYLPDTILLQNQRRQIAEGILI